MILTFLGVRYWIQALEAGRIYYKERVLLYEWVCIYVCLCACIVRYVYGSVCVCVYAHVSVFAGKYDEWKGACCMSILLV